MSGRICFWRTVNYAVTDSTPFAPLKLFRNCPKSMFSKTTGGVHGGAQARVVLRSSTSVFHSEQKVVSQTLKGIAINAFIAWGMNTKENLLRSSDSFRGLDQHRRALNRVQSFGDLVLDVSKELLTFAKSRTPDSSHRESDNVQINVSHSEAIRLEKRVVQRKGKIILFFNSGDDLKLGFKSGMHIAEHTRGAAIYCSSCGNGNDGKRGGRTADKCKNVMFHCAFDVHELREKLFRRSGMKQKDSTQGNNLR